MYDPSTGASTPLPDMPSARYACAGLVLPDGRFAVLGGRVQHNEQLRSCVAYSFERGAWEALPDMQEGRVAFGAWVVGGCIIAAGGESSTTEVLDVAEGRWRYVPSAELPDARYATRFALVPR